MTGVCGAAGVTEIAAFLSGEGARLSLSLIGILVGVCFGIISFLPKFIEEPYGPRGEVVVHVERRNARYAQMIKRARRTALFLLSGGMLLWVAALVKGSSPGTRDALLLHAVEGIAVLGGILVLIGLSSFLYAIARYPIGDLTTWQGRG